MSNALGKSMEGARPMAGSIGQAGEARLYIVVDTGEVLATGHSRKILEGN